MTMELDAASVSAMAAVVVLVSGALFLLETFLRRDEAAGRVWALGFLAGMLSTMSYLLLALDPASRWPAAVGNAAFVAAIGFIWAGCRRFNARRIGPALAVVLAGSTTAFLAAVFEPDGGVWVGAAAMFIAIAVFAALGAVESSRGEMRRSQNAVGLTIALGAQSAFSLARTVVILALGPDSELFRDWFGTNTSSIVTVVLTIVALLTTSTLRAGRAGMRGVTAATGLVRSDAAILHAESFALVLGELAELTRLKGETLGVISVRIDDLPQIATAYGKPQAELVSDAFQRAARVAAPSQSVVGEDGSGGILLSIVPASASEARALSIQIREAVVIGIRACEPVVVPLVTSGTALSGGDAVDTEDLIHEARAAAGEEGTEVRVVGEPQADVRR